MNLHELYSFDHENKSRKRRGRGAGSGLRKTAGKGHKGQKARAGSGPSVGFEGGQMPLIRRLPKRGFKNRFRKVNNVFNLEDIEQLFPDQENVDLSMLRSKTKNKEPVKILARGEITRSLKIEANSFSQSAKQKIEKAGGQCIKVEE